MQRPEIKHISKLSIFKPQTSTLSNGVRLDVINLGDQPVTRLDIAFEGGRCDGGSQTVSEMLSAILREGTDLHDAKEIAETLDFHGAWLGCDASTHTVTLSLYSLNRNFEKVVPTLAEIIFQPSFPCHEFENIKSLAVNNLRTSHEKVSFLAAEYTSQIYYGSESNIGKPVTEDSIKSISINELKQFYLDWITPQNMRISLSGHVEPQMVNVIDRHFGQRPFSGNFKPSASDLPMAILEPRMVPVDKPDALQSAIRITIPAMWRSAPDYIPLRILVTALGGYFGSRLMANIREDKGYTYGISSALLGYRDHSTITISCQCDTGYTFDVLYEINREIQKLQEKKIPSRELKRLKTYMLSELARTLDTPFSIADYYASIFNNHIPKGYFDAQIEIINSITSSELMEIAQRHLSTLNMLTVIAGNRQGM